MRYITVIFVCLLPFLAHADLARFSGNDILQSCETKPNEAFCIGYIQTIADTL